MRSRPLLVAGLVAFVVGACDAAEEPLTGPSTPVPPQTPNSAAALAATAGDRTPFQQSIMRSIAERQAAGLPVPARVAYEYDVVAAPAASGLAGLQAAGAPAPQTVTARTVIEFGNPEEAGLEEWPDVVVEGEVPAGGQGFVREGDYTPYIRSEIARRYPDSNTDFETGPRTYTFAETMVIAAPAAAAPGPLMSVQMADLAAVTTANELLMGFTVLGPNLDYHIEYSTDICVFWFFGCHASVELVDFWAGFKMDWTIGMRLPLEMQLSTPGPVLEGSVFPASSAVSGRDWDDSRFQLAGVSGEDGNEFLLQFVFKVGLFVEVFEVDVVNLGVDIDVDRTASFETPLGPGATIALPSINQSIWGRDIGVVAADVGVSLTPRAGSDRYTANWAATGSGGGSGALTYTTSGLSVPLGNLSALDGPGNASVQLSDMRYHFTNFGLDLGLYFYISVLGYGGTWNVPVTGFSLAGVTGGLYLGTHAGTPNTVALSIPIQNVAPVVTLSRTGATPINGVPTFLAGAGGPVTFSARVTDPGQDDLTLSWDWGDGAPAPDESVFYELPHDLTTARTHDFGSACVYQVRLSATDDDGATDEDQVAVVALGSERNAARLEGYWQHQLGRMGNTDFTDAELGCLLSIVAHMSTVFGEVRDISTLAAAHDVLFLKQNGGSVLQQLDRELLVAWLNYANGAMGGADPLAGASFLAMMGDAEADRLEPSITTQLIRRRTQALHRVTAAAAEE